MTDPTEQTADPTVLEVVSAVRTSRPITSTYIDWDGEEVTDTYHAMGRDPAEIVAALGIDPDMPLSRLVEDLAIAARVRACKAPAFFGAPGPVTTPDRGSTVNADTLLHYLLHGAE